MVIFKNFLKHHNKFFATLMSLVVGFVFASIVLMIFGVNPFDLLSSLVNGAFIDDIAVNKTLQLWTLYIFLGLSVMIGFKIGLFNIGVAGQMTFAMIMSYMFVYKTHDMAAPLMIFIAFIIVIASAALYAVIAATLKSFFGVNEVVTTIMLNWIAVKILNFLYDRKEIPHGGGFETIQSLPNGVNTSVESISPYFTWMIFVAFGLVLVIFVVMKFTKLGQKIVVTGTNKDAATYSGYNQKALVITTFAFSGLIAGLATMTYFFGIVGSSGNNIAIGSMRAPLDIGFLGIAIALVGMNNAFGVLLSALFFTILKNPTGVAEAQTSLSIPSDVVDLYTSCVIYFVAIVNIFIEFITIDKIKKAFKKYISKMKSSSLTKGQKTLESFNFFTFGFINFVIKTSKRTKSAFTRKNKDVNGEGVLNG